MEICSSSWVRHIRSRARHKTYFTKAAVFLVGLAMGHGLVKNAVVDCIMLYLVETWENDLLKKAAAVVNIGEAIWGIIGIIVSIVTDAWLGCFIAVLITTPSYILGLTLLYFSTWLFSKEMKPPIFYVSLLLIMLGTAGRNPPFLNFFEDQLNKKKDGDEQVYDGSTFWWRLCKFIGATISVFSITDSSWKATFLISAAVMGGAYGIMLLGILWPSYKYTKPSGSPFFLLFKVVKAAFAKRSLDFPPSPSAGYYLYEPYQRRHFLRKSFLRCIDKAAIKERAAMEERASPRQQGEAGLLNGQPCTVAEMLQAKSVLRLIPLWLAFILYGVVTAAGSTFFILQTSGLKQDIGSNFKFPINTLFVIRSFVSSIIAFVADVLLSRYCSENQTWKLRGGLIRVGTGLGVSIVCCGVASIVEHHRLHLIRSHGNPDTDPELVLPMSVLVLVSEYILLGLMDGLSEEGLSELFYVLVDESMAGIESPVNELMLGIGKVLSVGCVFMFRRWFGDTINTSRLDKYFFVLMFLSVANLLFYAGIGHYYVHVQKEETRLEIDHPQHEGAALEEENLTTRA